MTTKMDTLINEYVSWVRNNIIIKEIGEWFEITTPFLDRHNDNIQIYAKKIEEGFLLTDDGYILNDLLMSGVEINTEHRRKMLQTTINGFGVNLNNNRIETIATLPNFPLKKHNLIQAMLSINDLFYLLRSSSRSTFYEDVFGWLDKNDIRFSSNIKLPGVSGYDYNFDFVIPKSKKYPERILHCINNPSKANTERFIFAWSDTKPNRLYEALAIPILNDLDNTISSSVITAFNRYDINPIKWSNINNSFELLAA